MTMGVTGRLRVSGLAKIFQSGVGQSAVVEGCSFTLEPGAVTVMVGPSGCGKTTLVNLIAGYEEPTRGTIELDGRTVRGPGKDRLVIFQEAALFPWMRVLENVAFGPLSRGSETRSVVLERARALLAEVGLEGFADRFPTQLSGGMQRRAELARAIINEPTVMLMDEPFRGLDALTRELMQEHFLRLFEAHPRTNLFVTSELAEALFLGDRLLLMSARPTHVTRAIDVDLPRPRTFEMLTSERFRELFEDALSTLHAEASKAYAAIGAP